MHLTIREMAEMKRMGHTVKAVYKTARGVPFPKFFRDRTEMDRFTASAELAGSKLVTYAERQERQ